MPSWSEADLYPGTILGHYKIVHRLGQGRARRRACQGHRSSRHQARPVLNVRSDLFSLGVVLYEMATGAHPFRGNTTALIFDQILNHAPTAPITLNSQLPPEFENVLNKSLEKDRDLRTQTAAELRADLKRLKSSSGDDRSLVYQVLRNGHRTLLSQPFDGSAAHTLFEPVDEDITDFEWSPSGKELALLLLKSTSDVVLIKDKGKAKN